MKSSFNAYGRTKKEYGPLHIPIWLGIVKRNPVGGTLDADFNIAGALYPAGTPINISGKVIKPLVAWEVVSFTAGDGTTVTTDSIVVRPAINGLIPEVGDFIQKVGATFDTKGKAAAVASVTAKTGADAGKYEITVLHSATIDTPSAGDAIALSSATAAGSNKSLAIIPNAYLYHDIWLGDLDVAEDDTFATGAAVMFHPEGILIDRTPAAAVKAAMKAAVPGVLQVEE